MYEAGGARSNGRDDITGEPTSDRPSKTDPGVMPAAVWATVGAMAESPREVLAAAVRLASRGRSGQGGATALSRERRGFAVDAEVGRGAREPARVREVRRWWRPRASVLASAEMKICCPICHKEQEVPEDFAYRPFCSQRCKTIDLGNWLGEAYRISRPITADDEEPGVRGEN